MMSLMPHILQRILRIILIFLSSVYLVLGVILLALAGLLWTGDQYIVPFLQLGIDSLFSIGRNLHAKASFFNSSAPPIINETLFDINMVPFLNVLATGSILGGVFICCFALGAIIGGCCSKRLITVYAILMFIVFAVKFIAAVFLTQGAFTEMIQNDLKTTIKLYYGGSTDTNTASMAWNYLMIKYDCCGITGYKDFDVTERWLHHEALINGTLHLETPLACCKTTGTFPHLRPLAEDCATHPTNSTSNWNTGCWTALLEEEGNAHSVAFYIFFTLLIGAPLFIGLLCLAIILTAAADIPLI